MRQANIFPSQLLLVAACFIASLLIQACPLFAGFLPAILNNDGDPRLEITIHIQETASLSPGDGFISTTGNFKTQKPGYTGPGYIDSLSGDSNIVYSIHTESSGPCRLSFRYAFGGTETNLRDACLVVNGVKVQIGDDDVLEFPYTGYDWTSWQESTTVTIHLIAGDNHIRLQPAIGRQRIISLTTGGTSLGTVTGLANIDRLTATGVGLSAGTNSTIFYRLTAAVYTDGQSFNETTTTAGSIVVSPLQDFYLAGTEISLQAQPAPGWEFQSWTGTLPSSNSDYHLTINQDLYLAARFIPATIQQEPDLVGFGAVQDDLNTTYILTGGLGGEERTVSSLNELQSALAASEALIIYVKGLITTPDDRSLSLNVASHKTLLSSNDQPGHIKNLELKLSGHNYIIRNLIFSEVIAADSLGGTGNDCLQLNGAQHVWIDHCEFYSSLGPSPIDVNGDGCIDDKDAKDYYDGLIDIKNGASFITLSNNYFHDHWKAILIGSSDDMANQVLDSKIRITICANYFRDINSRSPLIRFGRAHIFNNYYHGATIQLDSTINARCYAQTKVEGNHFNHCKYTIGSYYDSSGITGGSWNLVDNIFENITTDLPTSTSTWTPTYHYTTIAVQAVKTQIPTTAGPKLLPDS